jgi:hypothetical protein
MPQNVWVQASKCLGTSLKMSGYKPQNVWVQASKCLVQASKMSGYKPQKCNQYTNIFCGENAENFNVEAGSADIQNYRLKC